MSDEAASDPTIFEVTSRDRKPPHVRGFFSPANARRRKRARSSSSEVVAIDVEEVLEAAELQDLFDDGRHAAQHELAAGLAEAAVAADEPADAAGIDVIDRCEVEADGVRERAGAEQLGERVAGAG